jgi:hypothetical protein
MLRWLSTDNNDGVGGDGSNGARRTNSKAGSSHSTAGNSGTDNGSRKGNIRNSPIRTQSRSRLEHRNVAPQQSSSPPPPVQLTEVSSSFYLPVIKQKSEGKVFRFIWMEARRDIP